jgi:enoyl-CoA hydratase/carnithine racemase
MTGTLMLSRLVRDDVMKDLVFTGRNPHAVRGAKKLINHLSNDRAKEHFALKREIIFTLIGSPNQVEAITANFEKREPKFGDVG